MPTAATAQAVQTVITWQEVWLEGIKIMGPAIITGLLGYFGARLQLKTKSVELKNQNEFMTRKALFDHYNDLRKDARKSQTDLQQTLGQYLGFAQFMKTGDGEIDDDTLDLVKSGMEIYNKNLPTELERIHKEMTRLGMQDYPQYKDYEIYTNMAAGITDIEDVTRMKDNLYKLVEVHSYYANCHDIVLQVIAEKLFEPYADLSILKPH
jgi:hypothetical protein